MLDIGTPAAPAPIAAPPRDRDGWKVSHRKTPSGSEDRPTNRRRLRQRLRQWGEEGQGQVSQRYLDCEEVGVHSPGFARRIRMLRLV